MSNGETSNYAIVLKCQDYQILVEDTEASYKKKIKSKWIESVKLFRKESELKKFGISLDSKIIKLELKSGKWIFLSPELKNKFKNSAY